MVNGREVVQIPIEDYNFIMGFIADEKKRKDDIYRERIAMAKQYIADGKPGVDPAEMVERCHKRAEERRRLRA